MAEYQKMEQLKEAECDHISNQTSFADFYEYSEMELSEDEDKPKANVKFPEGEDHIDVKGKPLYGVGSE